MLEFAYFPGCSAKATCQELNMSTLAVASVFDIDLQELDDPGCTGARQFRAIDEHLHLVANGRILAMAEALGRDLAVVCDTCLLNLMETNQRLKTDEKARLSVNKTLSTAGLEFCGKIEVKHFLWILTDDVGEDRLREKIVRRLDDLKIAPFYGCHIQRPNTVFGDEESEEVPALDKLCNILGADLIAYKESSNCCGFHVMGAEKMVAYNMSGENLVNAKRAGADCVVTPCPLCHTVMDTFQPEIESKTKKDINIPILHVSQMVGLAVGLEPEVLGLSRHMVDNQEIIVRVAGGELDVLGSH